MRFFVPNLELDIYTYLEWGTPSIAIEFVSSSVVMSKVEKACNHESCAQLSESE
jgi:hypothetical protein